MNTDNNNLVSKEEHNKHAMIENLVWEIAKIINPNDYINPKKVERAKNILVTNLSDN